VYYVPAGYSSLIPTTIKPSSPWLVLHRSLGLHWRMRLLHDCIDGQRTVVKYIGREEIQLAVGSPEQPKSALSKKQLSAIIKHIQAADPSASCYTPVMVLWGVLSFATRRNNGSNCWEFIPVFEVVHRHESFLQRFGDNILDPDLEEGLTRLFSLAFSILLGVAPGVTLGRASESPLDTTKKIKYLQELDKEALRLEETAKGIAAMSRLLSAHEQRTTAALDTMTKDMAEMKLQIGQRTHSVQLLLELQQKSHSGMSRPLLLSQDGAWEVDQVATGLTKDT
jgi:hypothetical protein